METTVHYLQNHKRLRFLWETENFQMCVHEVMLMFSKTFGNIFIRVLPLKVAAVGLASNTSAHTRAGCRNHDRDQQAPWS